MNKFMLFLCCILGMVSSLIAQQPPTAEERSVQVSAIVQNNPPQINFSWKSDPGATAYTVYKKNLEDTDWGEPLAIIAGASTSWYDSNVNIGEAYEYAFFKEEFSPAIWTVCVPPETELTFTANDMYGIGLCCSFGFGNYSLQACGQQLAYGDDFGSNSTESLTVCNQGTECTDLIITIIPDMFPNSTSWILTNNETGQQLATSGPQGTYIAPRPEYGFIYAGIQVPPIENRGSILLMIESSLEFPLTNEIDQLELDLIRDGWKVFKRNANSEDDVTEVKAQIQDVYSQNSDLKALYLLGHIPVPYSGNIYPDTHSEHKGAWAADTYYGELNGTWTDSEVNSTTAFFSINHNVPGDGKFDQDAIPTKMELQVSRVSFHNMPAFSDSEVELTRQYLQKSHAFKEGEIEVQRRALIDDNFGQTFAAPAASGFRNFAPMFGHEQIDQVDYFSTMSNESYLWSYGCGSGNIFSSEGVGTTTDFANNSLQTVFTMLFGSQFGDWDYENNFLRAPLASGLTLSNCWAGSPPWTFHHMALGHHLGFAAIKTMNSDNAVYMDGPQLTHLALMGDPSLRMHPVKPPTDLAFVNMATSESISWLAPENEDIAGYNVYRAGSLNGNYEKINPNLVTGTSFVDQNPIIGNNVYIVKTVKLETSGSGTYYNMSLGAIDSTDFDIIESVTFITPEVQLYPNPTYGKVHLDFINVSREYIQIDIINTEGRIMYSKTMEPIRHILDLSDFTPGVYIVKVESDRYKLIEKVLLLERD